MRFTFFSNANMPKSRPTLRSMFQRIHLMIIAITLLMAGIPLSVLSVFTLKSYAEHNLQLVAATISYTSAAAVVFGDKPAAQDALTLIAKKEQVYEARIYDQKKELLASWTSPTSMRLTLDDPIRKWLLPKMVVQPVVSENEVVGYVTLTAGGATMVKFLSNLLLGLLSCLVITALLSFWLVRRMHTGIVDELQNIAHVARLAREKREFSIRVRPSQIAEINELSRGFNSLLREMELQHADLMIENDQLSYKALHDPLTSLPNRSNFMSMLESMNMMQEQICVMFLDGDGFKAVNDTWGHSAGDHVLTTIAERLKTLVGKNDLVARMGGDEFSILLRHVVDQDDVMQVIEKILKAMRRTIYLPNGEEVFVSLSIGFTLSNAGSTPAELLEKADAAMYHSKHNGGGWSFS
ncbi:adenylyl cyclase [Hafnia paralvei ATCC 29927]|jgi:diguanylate cyclase|uniref:diguanylate cyclase domain-containing protein n=1 Tax=Hafnia TaxID=568 RepID=UPI000343AEF0|nr:diguanylate cyclase [Hafnia paralvei]EFV41639.2 diguanylate cyclase (GGDEF) domain-containing protein [Enterobacteriaceae bacterium 9_2_54FAA]MDU1191344.1 diguanylate cyclase [Enterobacteriaceae bacterium]MCE9882660.1 diguanylate cyclase [Hafnia paralvei]MCE9908488.1 diguanylate cyclase [Hafnia paralvei]MCE9910801.1 diguanylate cyclase [Hafnia paralvei]